MLIAAQSCTHARAPVLHLAKLFHALAEPTAEEVAEVAKRTALRVQKILARQGRTLDGTGERDAHDEQPAEQLALSACYGAAASGLGLDGDRAGQPFLRIVEPSLARRARDVAASRHLRGEGPGLVQRRGGLVLQRRHRQMRSNRGELRQLPPLTSLLQPGANLLARGYSRKRAEASAGARRSAGENTLGAKEPRGPAAASPGCFASARQGV